MGMRVDDAILVDCREKGTREIGTHFVNNMFYLSMLNMEHPRGEECKSKVLFLDDIYIVSQVA